MHDAGETLISLFRDRVRASSTATALHVPHGAGGFRKLTWKAIEQDVLRMAAILARHDVAPSDRVVQVSENRYEWILLDLAVHVVGGVHVAIHSSLAGPQIVEQIVDCGARLAFVSTAEQAAKFAGYEADLPRDLRWVVFDPPTPSVTRHSLGVLPDLPAIWETEPVDPQPLWDTAEKIRPGDLATILYTSGTTGEPKGVMLTHANLVSNTRATLKAFDYGADDLRLSWLPLSHIFARTCDLYVWIAAGCELALAESREKIIDNCQTLRPTTMNGVPYFYDKVRQLLVSSGEADKPGRLLEMLGGRMRLCNSGGAALADETAEFFWQRGVQLIQGYGLTESSPVITASTPSAFKLGTVGRPIPGVEVGITDEGEIVTRGPHVMLGYWNRPDDTADAIREEWLMTGDLGYLDEEGFLRITGRKKELIVTSAGKNIAPVYLENLLLQSPLISQAMIVGEGKSYLSALLVPHRENLRARISERRIPIDSAADELSHPGVLAIYRDQLDACLKNVSPQEQVRRFTLLGRPLTIELGELTPTLKLRRAVIQKHFADAIEAMYAAANCPAEGERGA